MRHGFIGLGLFVAAFVAACSGSSSETPWPVEPIDTDPGPAGESLKRGNVIDTKALPNVYGKGGGEAVEDGEGGAGGS